MPRALNLTAADLEKPLLPWHELRDIPDRLHTMMHQESHEYKCFDYLIVNASMRKKAAKPVDEDCRVKMCEWCYQVVDFCKFRRETVGIGMSYLDRYLCSDLGKHALSDRKEYQLVAMTCLYIAIKLHEPLEMETSLLADLSRGCYTEMEFANMEKKILEALVWRVSGPTTLSFVQNYLMYLPDTVHECVTVAVFDYARYQTELAVADHAFVKLKPSVVGMAALLNAMEGMDSALLPPRAIQKFTKNVCKIADLDIEQVEAVQWRLSTLMTSLLNDDTSKQFDRAIEAQEVQAAQQKHQHHHEVSDDEGPLSPNPPVRRRLKAASPDVSISSTEASPVSVRNGGGSTSGAKQ